LQPQVTLGNLHALFGGYPLQVLGAVMLSIGRMLFFACYPLQVLGADMLPIGPPMLFLLAILSRCLGAVMLPSSAQ